MKTYFVLAALLWLSAPMLPAGNAGFETIVREARRVDPLAPEAAPWVTRLESEVRKILQAGHLMPFRVQYGEGRPRHLYAEPWMMMLTLARAYPYVAPETQTAITAYLRQETRRHAPWSKTALGPEGAYRQGDPAGVPETGLPPAYKPTGTLLYALWLYGHHTGDWPELKTQWATLQTLYRELSAAPPTYESISGAIALARMAKVFGDAAAEERFSADAVKLMQAGTNFEAFRRHAHLAYSGKPDWVRGTDGIAFALFHLTPEVARYIRGQPALQAAIDRYVDRAVAIWPLWWMAQAPVGDWGYFDEGSCAGPETRMMLFNYFAWVRPAPAAELAARVDVPDALIGDCYYLQNLVTAIEAWGRPQWRSADINDAIVFTMGETTSSDKALEVARQCGSEVIVRGWFKWAQAPPVERWRSFAERAHQSGILFGGGITCSALYDAENGITRDQLLDMATRGPDGLLVDAWGQRGIRHGSLSSPAYLDYLFRWCREQMDAGVDYLFMDEHTAALGAREGYDDHSLRAFRDWLQHECDLTRGWTPTDPRWSAQFQVALTNRSVCPDGTMASFDYRGYLRARNQVDRPDHPENPLASLWHSFRGWRDDRAWKSLTDRIRAYARQQNRRVLISANGLARYVDLQVLGVWDQWLVRDGHIDLGSNLLPYWRGLVAQGRELAGGCVPVVLFHDWGMGDPPFPWQAVPPRERELWLRTRAAEIYAAGARFAFPVLGPFGCDAGRDGLMPAITRQARFYQAHRDLYGRSEFLGAETVRSDDPHLSLAVWQGETPSLLVVHVINRDARQGQLARRETVRVQLPLNRLPDRAIALSPDWPGERAVACRVEDDALTLTLTELEAYAVVVLRFAEPAELARLRDPQRMRLASRWERPARDRFRVRPDGSVEHAYDLNGLLQGRLHTHLRNPPTFVVNAEPRATLAVHVRAVATQGARLESRIDGQVAETVELPDRDGKNDSGAAEYDRVVTLAIPAGRHELTLDNTGADWLVLTWMEFQGRYRD